MSRTDVSAQLKRLSDIRPGTDPIISCYLKLEPRDRARGKYLIKLKNRVRQVLAELPAMGLDRTAEEAVKTDLSKIQRALTGPGGLPPTQGIALFASTGLKLFERIPLPSVYRSRIVVDRTAYIRELLAVEDEVGRIVTVVLDRTGAKFFEVTAFAAKEISTLNADATRGGRYRSDRHDAREHTYNNRIRNETHRHFEAVADTLFNIDRREPVHGILLAGIGTGVTGLGPFLHPYLQDRLIGSMKLNLKKVTPAAVHAATLEARGAWERKTETDIMTELADAVATRWAVNGITATLHALAKGQVRRLLVDPDSSAPGYRCTDTGRLSLKASDCRAEGGAVAVPDVIDDAIEEALRQRVEIEVVHSSKAATAVDGLAGFLRFR
jgi:peptide subunit release factor 1 (eRF1)